MFFTDWEGPWVLTDFAYEIAIAFFNNHEFFERLSQYDDYLVLVEKKEGYEAGDTLKLLAPFIVALGVSSEELKDLAEKVVTYTPDAEDSMDYLLKKGFEPVVISTSYVQFLEISAEGIGITKNLHGTVFEPERYSLPKDEREIILEAVEIIATLPEIELPPDEKAKRAIDWLNDFFWNKLSKMEAGKILEDVKAVGGRRKLEVVRSYGAKNPIVIGDSISDHAMLSWARNNGLAVSFNGNEFAVENSNLAVVSDTTFAEAYIVEAYLGEGFEGVKRAVRFEFDSEIADKLKNTKFYWLEKADVKAIIEESKAMRRKLRGLAGALS
jgi:predicted HAD superfamily phosphohydrolase